MKIKRIILLVLMLIGVFSCKYDDDALWDKVNSLDNRVSLLEKKMTQMNSDINSISVVVNALQNKVYVLEVKEINGGYQIVFTDGKTIQIKNGLDGLTPHIGENNNWWIGNNDTGVTAIGKDGINGLTPYIGKNGNWWIGSQDTGISAKGEAGKNAPIISIAQYEEKYYWVQIIDGVQSWLTDNDGNKIPVSGEDGITPILRINTSGFWIISYDTGITFNLLLDENGNPIKAIGQDGSNGENGDSFFSDVKIQDGILILVLKDGTILRVPICGNDQNQELLVSGTVSIDGTPISNENLSVVSFFGKSQLLSSEFSVNCVTNHYPQPILIKNDNGNIVLCTRAILVPGEKIEINERTTAIGLVVTHPLFVQLTNDIFEEVVEIIESTNSFPLLVDEVKKNFSTGGEIFDINNLSLMLALNNVYEEICSNIGNNSRSSLKHSRVSMIPGLNLDPFDVSLDGTQLKVTNRGLAPTYEAQVYYNAKFLDLGRNNLVKSRGSYGIKDLLNPSVHLEAPGEPWYFDLSKPGKYRFYFDRSTEKAKKDLTNRLMNDCLSILGINVELLFKNNTPVAFKNNFLASAVLDISQLLINPDTSWQDVTLVFSKWSATIGAAIHQNIDMQELGKFLGKVLVIYNGLKGSGNYLARMRLGFTAPYYVDFCLVQYDNEVTPLTNTQIEINSGNEQEGYANQRLLEPIEVSVKVFSEDGTELERSSYQKVKFEVVSGGGEVRDEILGTEVGSNKVSTYWTLGSEGEQLVKAVVVDMITGLEASEPVYFTARLYESPAVTVRLDWSQHSGYTDIDLHVVDPYGEEIYFANPYSGSGGYLDRDDTVGPGPEHIRWENAVTGTYEIYVHYFPNGDQDRSIVGYNITVFLGDKKYGARGSIAYDQMIRIGSFTVSDPASRTANDKVSLSPVVVNKKKNYPQKK